MAQEALSNVARHARASQVHVQVEQVADENLLRLEVQDSKRFWRLYLPLAVDVCPVGLVWILFPAQFHTPMATIALFAPDVFSVIVTITVLTLGWAMARTCLTFFCFATSEQRWILDRSSG